MKNIQKLALTFALFSMILLGCNSKKSISKKSYFEGQIISSIQYTIIDPSVDLDQLKTIYGTKEVMTFKKGFFRRDFYNPEGSLVLSAIYDQLNNKLYMEYAGEDETYFSIPSENNFICDFEEIGTDMILDTPCKKLKVNLKPKTGVVGYDDNMTLTYYLSETFLLNPEWYDKYQEICFSDMITKYPGMTMGADMVYSGFIQKTRAIGMTFMEVPMDKFRPDTSRKLIKN